MWGTPGHVISPGEVKRQTHVMSTPRAFIRISLNFLHMVHSEFYKLPTDIKVIANLFNRYDFPDMEKQGI